MATTTRSTAIRRSGQGVRLWLAERYGSIDELNRAWGTAFWSMNYNSLRKSICRTAW